MDSTSYLKENLDRPNGNSIEVETVDGDTFEILENATNLGTLLFEFNETKKNLAARINQDQYIPQQLFRNHSKSVAVSDISSSLWCELQVEYRYLHPYLKTTPEWNRLSAAGKPVQCRTKVMLQGSAIHFEQERESREPVKVETVTKEDRSAVELIDTLVKLESVSKGNVEREIKVLGRVFGSQFLLSGVIDQLQYCSSDDSLIILELKTRKTKSLPEDAQKQGHHLQVMIYKMLLDSFIHGFHDHKELLQQKGLQMNVQLSPGPTKYIEDIGIINKSETIVTLGELVDSVGKIIKGLCLPLVDSLMIQYMYQVDREVLGVEPVLYEEDWARKMVHVAYQYWSGERNAKGVDIEDSWKCDSCQFKDVCVWKKRQVLESSPVKKWPEEFHQPSPKRVRRTLN